jgi:hypothetical protein
MLNQAGIRITMAFAMVIAGHLLYIPQSNAQGNLIIMPRRVVFEGTKRTQEFNVANTGADTSKYLVSVVHYRMLENGAFESIETPDSGQYFADKNFRFFPRSVVLGPNESQTIKVQAINTSELKPGEYRSHLYFRAVAKEPPPEEKANEKLGRSVTVRLVPTFGIAIPVIIRTGVLSATTAILKPALVMNGQIPNLEMTITRSGNVSVYGDIVVKHLSAQGKITEVGLAKGFAIYTPNHTRRFTLGLDTKSGIDYHKGKLLITFTAPAETKSVLIAEASLNLL